MARIRRAFAPGRVNLIGDHTDYALGLALPMAISLGTTASFEPGGAGLVARSEQTDELLDLVAGEEQAAGSFAAMASAVAELLGWPSGSLLVSSDLPLGSGLSSSASLIIACALAMGCPERGVDLALLAQEAERLAGQDVGLLDQMAIIEGQPDHAVLIDFAELSTTPVPVPDDLEIVIVHSGEDRSLAAGAYAERRIEVSAAEAIVGPLPGATAESVAAIEDPIVARRAHHVAAECARVVDFAAALSDDPAEAGRLMLESHRSLSELFAVSTPRIDAIVDELSALPGVLGARMTGGGFGGCIVVLSEPRALDPTSFDRAWRVRPSAGAQLS